MNTRTFRRAEAALDRTQRATGPPRRSTAQMEEKIKLLEPDLPEFLVSNRRIFAILSKGIHELEEEECLGAFEFLKRSIFYILADDKHKKEEIERRQAAAKAIADFQTRQS